MKKNMRKVAALGLCVALGATMLTACGGSKGKICNGRCIRNTCIHSQ